MIIYNKSSIYSFVTAAIAILLMASQKQVDGAKRKNDHGDGVRIDLNHPPLSAAHPPHHQLVKPIIIYEKEPKPIEVNQADFKRYVQEATSKRAKFEQTEVNNNNNNNAERQSPQSNNGMLRFRRPSARHPSLTAMPLSPSQFMPSPNIVDVDVPFRAQAPTASHQQRFQHQWQQQQTKQNDHQREPSLFFIDSSSSAFESPPQRVKPLSPLVTVPRKELVIDLPMTSSDLGMIEVQNKSDRPQWFLMFSKSGVLKFMPPIGTLRPGQATNVQVTMATTSTASPQSTLAALMNNNRIHIYNCEVTVGNLKTVPSPQQWNAQAEDWELPIRFQIAQVQAHEQG